MGSRAVSNIGKENLGVCILEVGGEMAGEAGEKSVWRRSLRYRARLRGKLAVQAVLVLSWPAVIAY